MSLITRCPACGTMFKVVPDQLRISDGWVRCGHCAEVFDASAYMQPEAAPATAQSHPAAAAPLAAAAPTTTPPAAAPAPVTAPLPLPPAPDGPASVPAPGFSPSSSFPPSGVDTFAGASHFTDSQLDRNLYKLLAEELAADAPGEGPHALPARDSSFADSRAPQPVPPPVSRPARLSRPSPLDEAFDDSRDADSALSDSTLDNVSFVRDARRKAFWRRPLVRAVLSLVILSLLAVLGLQVAVQERDRIAAMEPRVRPLLQQLCEQLQCTVAPLRQIESVVIDSSSFTKLRADTYRLSFTVKNNAPLPLAMPAIELALTDGADQPVLRRVLTPADLGAASPNLSPVLAAGGEWSGTFPLNVSGNGARIVGYRLLAFYP